MRTGVLLIHGFTGGPFEVQPLADYIEERTEWLVEIPTLPGHGEKLKLKNVSAESWMMEAELAIRKLKEQADRIIVVGFSMGGLIAMYLATRYKLDRLVLLSAAVKYINPVQLLEEIRNSARDAMSRKLSENPLFHLYEYKLIHTPISAAVEFLRIVRFVEPYYKSIKVPVIIVQGEKDGIVPPSAANLIFETIGSEEKLLITSANSQHLICYSDDSEDWFEHVLAFMHEDDVN
ncbi:carboxylesterase [Planomicrobium sp. YIM 101495]|uniref:alpha/beta hydrolase n=1 Tax=Planomicrobium sp. YIM 101495 TaxID=2665160 RepID=UPI0012B884F9|nr:alpha/beta fold hydrolase [Planomicrobium sp. YIM 101495]MTD31578.1 alpha/beta fold hydrolase [Planomicrobium sp. YIM 101495]